MVRIDGARWIVSLTFFGVMLSFSAFADVPVQQTTESPDAKTKALIDLTSYVNEASLRFSIPASWIWAVLKAESAGKSFALSPKGAMGLMQLMPDTWQMLRVEYGLGDNAYHPRDNILAGAAYLRQMHDRFGISGFLAAYNAGPGRMAEHLRTGRALPQETQDYVARISRRLGFAITQQSISASSGDQSNVNGPLFSGSDAQLFVSIKSVDGPSKALPRVIDFSALTPHADGIFIHLSSR